MQYGCYHLVSSHCYTAGLLLTNIAIQLLHVLYSYTLDSYRHVVDELHSSTSLSC